MAPIAGTWEEREQVRELYARYAFTIDYNRFEEWVRCFTEDGVFESPIFGRHQGSQGLLKFTAQYKESMGGAKVVHVMSNVTFRLDGEHGTGDEDHLRRVNGEWLFESRKVHIDGHR